MSCWLRTRRTASVATIALKMVGACLTVFNITFATSAGWLTVHPWLHTPFFMNTGNSSSFGSRKRMLVLGIWLYT